jgi:hypothetical protein
MAAVIQRNEVEDRLRQLDLGPIYKSDGTLAPVDTDFVALGILWVTDPDDPEHLKAAGGSCVNKRRSFALNVTVESTDTGTNTLEATAHGLLSGDGFAFPSATGGGVDNATPYWIIYIDDDHFQVAESLEDAYAETEVDITADLTGVSFVGTAPTCKRGMPGRFVYTFLQPETDVGVTELWAIVDGGDYALVNNGGGSATALLMPSFDGFEALGENGHTYGDLLRLVVRTLVAEFTKTGDDYLFRDLADSKDSHSGTVAGGGRTASTIIDPT